MCRRFCYYFSKYLEGIDFYLFFKIWLIYGQRSTHLQDEISFRDWEALDMGYLH